MIGAPGFSASRSRYIVAMPGTADRVPSWRTKGVPGGNQGPRQHRLDHRVVDIADDAEGLRGRSPGPGAGVPGSGSADRLAPPGARPWSAIVTSRIPARSVRVCTVRSPIVMRTRDPDRRAVKKERQPGGHTSRGAVRDRSRSRRPTQVSASATSGCERECARFAGRPIPGVGDDLGAVAAVAEGGHLEAIHRSSMRGGGVRRSHG